MCFLFFMLQLGQLLAATCKELPGPKESRRTAKDLWEVVVQICSVSSQHKRGNDGRVSLIKQRESTLGIMYRYVSISLFFKLSIYYFVLFSEHLSFSLCIIKMDNVGILWCWSPMVLSNSTTLGNNCLYIVTLKNYLLIIEYNQTWIQNQQCLIG